MSGQSKHIPTTAILYTRVSSDEQAKGYSLDDQLERLTRYCHDHQIAIIAHFKEDHSAKTFNRPAFENLLRFVRQNKKKADTLLFVNWSRFSRNAPDAYMMIHKLQYLHLTPQAIDQPLDLSVPENKMMLGIYLLTPEIENDRRRLNIIHGQRRAKKQGRWISAAPYGYINDKDENQKPLLIPDKEKAPLVRWAFEQVATGSFSTVQVWKTMRKQGMNLCRNAFYQMLKNRVYTGQVFIPAWEDEPEKWTEGVHRGIVDKVLFFRVQAVLSGHTTERKQPKKAIDKQLPIRGLLRCKRCGGKLTGSGSLSRTKVRYYYYHCQKGCKERFRADDAHRGLAKIIRSIRITDQGRKAYLLVLREILEVSTVKIRHHMKMIAEKRHKIQWRLTRLQDSFMDGKITAEDYSELKQRCNHEITALQAEHHTIKNTPSELNRYLSWGGDILLNPEKFLSLGVWQEEKPILEMVFTGQLTYNGTTYQGYEINELLNAIISRPKHLVEPPWEGGSGQDTSGRWEDENPRKDQAAKTQLKSPVQPIKSVN